jgi:hypothetical protein
MVTIPHPVLLSMHLRDDNVSAAIARASEEVEALKAEIEDIEQRISIDLALPMLGVKRVFSNSPSSMEIAAYEREAPRGSVFVGRGLQELLDRRENAKLRLDFKTLAIEGLRLIQAKRRAITE